MIEGRLLFHLLVATIMLIIGIRAGAIFSKWRTKYNLATLVVIIIIFIGIVLNFLYPGELIPGAGTAIQILLAVIFVVLLSVFLDYPNIKRFLNRRKTKNK